MLISQVTTMTNKEFDIIVYGATGFTGVLVARYLLQEYEPTVGAPNAITWAIAGRNAKKLQAVKNQLKLKVPSVPASTINAIPVLVADSNNEEQVVAMMLKTKVVLTVVGPYHFYGEPIVKACAENGVHYCDLTAETLWIERMMQKYEAAAKKTGAIIVNCCGISSVPSDITTMLLVDSVKRHRNSGTSNVTICYTALTTSLSSGTLASIFSTIEYSTSEELARAHDPFLLTNENTRTQKKALGLTRVNTGSICLKHEDGLGRWSSMFVGASLNAAIVHRSNFLQKNGYGDKFVYRERMAVGGLIVQIMATTGLLILGLLFYFSMTRSMLKRFVLNPGEGPSEDVLRDGKMIAQGVAYDESGSLAARSLTIAMGDPSYVMTSKVIAEAALCLTKGEVSDEDVKKGGFFTPAYAFGAHLVKSLHEKKIISFDIELV